MKINNEAPIFVAGHHGLVGSAIVRCLKHNGFDNIVTRTHQELDLTQQQAVRDFFQTEKIDSVILAAAKVGGINANNTYPADFIYQNLMIQTNVIHEAYYSGIKNLLFLGSSCIYPKHAPQPMPETALLTGPLESTNEPYGIAKIAGIKTCESYNRQFGSNYRSIMPTNLYGPGDNFNLENSHVIPALIRKFYEAKQNNTDVTIWGSGNAKREFLHVDDMALACLFVMRLDDLIYQKNSSMMCSHINVGSGHEISIRDLVNTICKVSQFKGDIHYDTSKPDGPPRKLTDTSRINMMGWDAKITLETGLMQTYQWFENHYQEIIKAEK